MRIIIIFVQINFIMTYVGFLNNVQCRGNFFY